MPDRPLPRRHLEFPQWPAAVYVIGDVHGCYDLLLALEDMILADAATVAGEKWLVLVGDYVDRGPYAAQVLAHLQLPPPDGFRRIALTGNHEVMMLDALLRGTGGRNWIANGGDETLRSYGLEPERLLGLPRVKWPLSLQVRIPGKDLAFLENLPISLSLPGLSVVHAGLRRGVPLKEQSETDLLWSRPDYQPEVLADGPRLVHGHTPLAVPFASPHRINVDTGAFATGRLTAARLTPDCAVKFLQTHAGGFPALAE